MKNETTLSIGRLMIIADRAGTMCIGAPCTRDEERAMASELLEARGIESALAREQRLSAPKVESANDDAEVSVDALIEASSLGTPEAKAARESVPQEVVDRVLARADELQMEHPDQERVLKLLIQRVGGNATMTRADLRRSDGYQLRWTDNGHTLQVIAIRDT